MIFRSFGRTVAVAACLLIAVPGWGARSADLLTALSLFETGRFDEALDILQPLALDHPRNSDVLFLLGMAATQSSQLPGTQERVQESLLDLGITAFRTILIDQPELVRVRLELARAFFFKGEDGLAKDHFERVLAGDVPEAVVANVNQFLARIRARRRWSMHFGFALQPDDNIGGASNERIIYILGLPFVRDVDELTTSGVGISIWAGGEYQYPLQESTTRLRLGGRVSRKEYKGGEFDDMSLSAYAGPRWLLDRDTDLSLLADLRQRWVSEKVDHDEWGSSIELSRRLSPTVTANIRSSVSRRQYRDKRHLDGSLVQVSLGGDWIPVPVVRLNATAGHAKENTESRRWRNASESISAGVQFALPRGFSIGGDARMEWKDYAGGWGIYTPGGVPRKDRTRTLSVSVFNRGVTIFGFSPKLTLFNDVRKTNAQLHDYRRNRGELQFVRQF